MDLAGDVRVVTGTGISGGSPGPSAVAGDHYPITTQDAPPLAAAPPGASPVDPAPLPRRGLFDRDWQKALVVQLAILAGLALLWVLWQVISPLMHTILLFALGGVLAFALAVPIDRLAARFGHRAAAIAVVYLMVAVFVVGGLSLLAGPFAAQASALVGDLPRYATELQTRLPQLQDLLAGYGVQTDVKASATTAVEQAGTVVLQQLLTKVAELGGFVFDALLVLVISVYFVASGAQFRQRTLALVPIGQRDRALFVEDNVARVLGGYLRGQLTLAAIIGVSTGLGMTVLGLPYSIVLGVLAGLFELVPMFGPILSAVPAIVVALFLPFPTVVWVLLFFLAIQQIENNVLAPGSAATRWACIRWARCLPCSPASSWRASSAACSRCLSPVSCGCCFTWSGNSVCHTFGKRAFETTDRSRNQWMVGLLGMGEGWHNHHHAFPRSAVHGLDRWQLNVSAWLIAALEALRLASDVQRIAPDAIARKRAS